MSALQKFKLDAQHRTETGRSACRRLRRSGSLPGILYGVGGDTVNLSLNANAVSRQLENEAFYSHILTLTIGDRDEQAVLKDLHRHPFEPRLLHIDFQRIDKNKAITMRVPLHFVNEEQCVGVKQKGGIVSHILTELELSCLPRDLPEYITVDIGELDLGETIHLGDLVMPSGVVICALLHGGDPRLPVVSVHAPRIAALDEEEQPEEEPSDEEAASAAGGSGG